METPEANAWMRIASGKRGEILLRSKHLRKIQMRIEDGSSFTQTLSMMQALFLQTEEQRELMWEEIYDGVRAAAPGLF